MCLISCSNPFESKMILYNTICTIQNRFWFKGVGTGYTKILLENLLKKFSKYIISNYSWINTTRLKILCSSSAMKQKCYGNDPPVIFLVIIYHDWRYIYVIKLPPRESLFCSRTKTPLYYFRVKNKNRGKLSASVFV